MTEKKHGNPGMVFLTPCRLAAIFLTVLLLGGIGVAAWAVVTFLSKAEDTGLYEVQVKSANLLLSVFDHTLGRWRYVCSSSSNQILASISCEEMGFVRALNYSVSTIPDGSKDAEDFFCVDAKELVFGKKIKEFLSPCSCESGEVLKVLCQDCGRRSLTEDRIVGGEESRLGRWPWQVSLQYDGAHQCGGSIISDRWIVSAAHCFPERYHHLSRWRVLLGSIYRTATHKSVHVAEVRTVVFHSSYLPFVDPNIDDNSRDIAILALTTPLQFTDYIQPVCLPTYGQRLVEGKMGTVTGWGNTEYYGQPPDVLQEANVPIISDAVCNAPEYYDNQITTSMFCAGYEKGGIDACQGDSGGPFVSEDTLSKARRYRLLGVVSWGTGCAMARKPGVYTKVSRFLPWISAAMRSFENVPGVHKMSRT
ncbi:serine protease hepsin isoform X1 [Megalops cyprinoides]|uniref:serine protease hepsin isoform X1 n=2 Tax=Megalops cyprinoides TaxID=118141 RepID=UPI001864E708|nr:serine protease hepsin isoform X1 [Megalops cyprinoides]